MSQENQDVTSLYDFFYINSEKINSYLSQLDNAGLLKSVKRTSSKTDSEGADCSVGLKGILSMSGKDNFQMGEGLEKFFDLSQSIPLATIEVLNESGLIHVDIENAHYGQIVLLKGSIKIVDLGMLSALWEDMMKIYVKTQNQALGKNPKNKALPDEYRIPVKVLENMPPFISLKTVNKEEDYVSWSTLDYKYMIGNPFDFSLKHSRSIRGTWYVLGVLDAKPYDDLEDDFDYEDMIDSFGGMMKVLRDIAGRKEDEYGVSPIAIWRVIQ